MSVTVAVSDLDPTLVNRKTWPRWLWRFEQSGVAIGWSVRQSARKHASAQERASRQMRVLVLVELWGSVVPHVARGRREYSSQVRDISVRGRERRA